MAKAYLKHGSQKETLMDEVAYLQLEGQSVVLQALFGEQKRVTAKIKEIDFLNSIVLLEKTGEETK